MSLRVSQGLWAQQSQQGWMAPVGPRDRCRWFTEGEEMVRVVVRGDRASGHSPGLSSILALSQN